MDYGLPGLSDQILCITSSNFKNSYLGGLSSNGHISSPGAPTILQTDNDSKFTSQVISELKDLWPDLTIVH